MNDIDVIFSSVSLFVLPYLNFNYCDRGLEGDIEPIERLVHIDWMR